MRSSASLNFQILNFPVRVHFSFFLVAVLLGIYSGNLIKIALWVLIVFVSVLLHEIGHAVAAEYYGRSSRIELYSMGGLTISTRNSLLSYPKEILISFAGPLAGFILGGIILLITSFTGFIKNEYLFFIVENLKWVSIGWGIINLIPILPLDGGSIMRNAYHWIRNPYDERTPLIISIGSGIFAILVVVVILGRGGLYLALVLGWLTYNNFMALRRGYWTDNFI